MRNMFIVSNAHRLSISSHDRSIILIICMCGLCVTYFFALSASRATCVRICASNRAAAGVTVDCFAS